MLATCAEGVIEYHGKTAFRVNQAAKMPLEILG